MLAKGSGTNNITPYFFTNKLIMKWLTTLFILLPLFFKAGTPYEIRFIVTYDLPTVEVYPVDSTELDLLARLIYSEDATQGIQSNMLIAQTVLYKTEKYNTDVYGAIFKTYKKGKAYYGAYTSNFNKKPLAVNYEAAEMVLKGYRPAPYGLAYFIGANDPQSKWVKYIGQFEYKQVGYHVYCFDPKHYKP